MNQILDKHVAERIIAECRDADALARFQRASYIVEELLDDLALGQVAKELRKRRMELGQIDRHCKSPPAPLPAAELDPVSAGDDVLTGKPKRRKAVAIGG